MITKDLKNVLDKLEDLPTLPEVLTKINNVVSNPNSTAKDVANIITLDQSLSLKVLKLINSAYYSFPRKINSVDQAVVILGFSTIKNLVLSISIFGMFKIKNNVLDLKDFWKHSLMVAAFAKTFSKHLKIGDADEMFLLGLIHDIGKLVQMKYFAEKFSDAIEKSKSEKKVIHKAEKEIMGFNHEDINYYLTDKWNLPDSLRIPISYIHLGKFHKEYELHCKILYLSDVITRIFQYGFPGDDYVPELSDDLDDLITNRKINWESLIDEGVYLFQKSLIFLDIFEEV